MVSPVELDLDRPLRVEVLVDVFLGREALEEEVSLPRQGLDLLDELFRVSLRREDLEEPVQVELDPADLFAQLGEAPLGDPAALDLLLQLAVFGLEAGELALHLGEARVLPVRHGPETPGEGDADQETVVPGLVFELLQFDRHVLPPQFPATGAAGAAGAAGAGLPAPPAGAPAVSNWVRSRSAKTNDSL